MQLPEEVLGTPEGVTAFEKWYLRQGCFTGVIEPLTQPERTVHSA